MNRWQHGRAAVVGAVLALLTAGAPAGITGGGPAPVAWSAPRAVALHADRPAAVADTSPVQTLWSWDFHEQAFFQVEAREVHGSGTVHILVEEGMDVPGPAIRRLAERFEDEIYPRVRDALGSEPIPGIDDDTAVTILLMDIRDGRYNGIPDATYYAGYFDPTNQRKQADLPEGQHSNEREMIYIDIGAPSDPAGDEFLQTVAHEFTHLIVWNHDPDEDDFMAEGICQLAVHVAGLGHPRQQVQAYLARPEASMTEWTGATRDYGKVYLFLLYLHDQFALRDPSWLRRLVAAPEHGMAGVAAVLPPGRSLAAVFGDYALALYVNTPAPGDGRFGFTSIDLGQRGTFLRARPNPHLPDVDAIVPLSLAPWTIRGDAFVVKRTSMELTLDADTGSGVCIGAASSTNPTPALGQLDALESLCLTDDAAPHWAVRAPPRDRSTAVFAVTSNASDAPAAATLTMARWARSWMERAVFLPFAFRR